MGKSFWPGKESLVILETFLAMNCRVGKGGTACRGYKPGMLLNFL
jgi:hypothetical protein